MHTLTFQLALLVFLAAPAYAISGYAHGPVHCYHFDAPSGWTMDNRAGAGSGVPMVFYPSASTWQSAPIAIYTRPVASSSGRSDPARIREQVDQVIQMYRSASENVQAKRVQVVRSKSGASGELWSFTGYSNGGAELVSYFAARQTVNFFVMQIASAGEVEASASALLELAASYRESTECKPCSVASSCTVPN